VEAGTARIGASASFDAAGSGDVEMTNAQVFGLGGMIVLGLGLHGLLTRGPCTATTGAAPATPARAVAADAAVELERHRGRTEQTQALIQHTKASTLTLADRVLLVTTNWEQKGGDLSIRERFYEWKDGQLVQVPVVDLK
jgi:hypothetical protein